jgi:hypothetical protein
MCDSREANEGKLFELSPPAAYVVVGIPTCSDWSPLEIIWGVLETVVTLWWRRSPGWLWKDSVVVSDSLQLNQYQITYSPTCLSQLDVDNLCSKCHAPCVRRFLSSQHNRAWVPSKKTTLTCAIEMLFLFFLSLSCPPFFIIVVCNILFIST